MKKLFLILLLTSCGKDDSANEAANAAAGDYVAVPFQGKKINIQNQTFTENCNRGWLTYVSIGSKCARATVSVTFPSNLEYWGVRYSENSAAIFEGYPKTSKIQIQGTDYYCYENQTSKYMFDKNGTKLYQNYSFISKTKLSKPGDIKESDIFYFGSDSNELCNAIY